MRVGCESLLCKSKENFELALDLKKNGKFDAAANRFYYSVFQAVKAYAVSKGKMRMDESDRVHKKAREIVKDDGSEYLDTIEEAHDLRTKADYFPEEVHPYELEQHFIAEIQDMRDRFDALTRATA